MDPHKAALIAELIPVIPVAVIAITTGWVITTWMRIKNGYPLEGSWGQKIGPVRNPEADQRVKLLGQENAQLRDELAAMKDRLAVVERIVTDKSISVASQIEALRDQPAEELRK